MRKLGYARVSTHEQNLAMQINALNSIGCDHIYTDEGISGINPERPGLEAALAATRAGDMLVVWRLDRLGRSLIHLVELIEGLSEKDVQFRSLTESIDTSSAGGRLVFHIMAALAEFERALISERTRAGMLAVRQTGRRVGRPPALSQVERDAVVSAVIEKGEHVSAVANRYNVHARTIRRAIDSHLSQT